MLPIARLFDDLYDDFGVYPSPSSFIVQRHPQSGQRRTARNELAVPTTHGDKFNLNLNLHQYDPSEISVKFQDGQLTVHGKKEKRSDDGSSYHYSEYKQSVSVPDNVISEQMKCQLDPHGFLRIEAPLKLEKKSPDERHIPIEFVQSTKQPQIEKK